MRLMLNEAGGNEANDDKETAKVTAHSSQEV